MKALLADEHESEVIFDEMPLSPYFTDSNRLDMDKLLGGIAALLGRVRQQDPNAWQHLKGICIAGQGDGLFPLDEDGCPFMHAITWQDTRASGKSVQINEMARTITEGIFNPAFAGSRFALLMWIKEHAPAQYKEIKSALTSTSFLLHAFTGQFVEDASNCAETFDLRKRARSEKLYALCGMEEALEKYPGISPADTVAGRVSGKAALLFGLPRGIPVAVGCLDATACALGTGNFFDAQLIVGTTTAVSVYLPDAPKVAPNNLFIDRVPFIHPRWRATLATAAGSSAIDYGRELFYPDMDYETVYGIAECVPPGAEGVLFLPFLYGERAPFICPEENGMFLGLSPRHGKAHLFRACIEGIVYSARHCMEYLPSYPARAVVSGGASLSPVFCQILADVLNVELTQTQGAIGALGCVKLIRHALGKKQTQKERFGNVFTPVRKNCEAYENQYRRYLKMIDLLWVQ